MQVSRTVVSPSARRPRLLPTILSLALLSMATSTLAAEVTVLTAARIHTMDPAQPRAEAMAFDASGRILAVGNSEALLARYPKAARLDAGSATVVPGLIDAHGHVGGLGLTQLRADLTNTSSTGEVLQR